MEVNSIFRVDGIVAAITGGGTGIGLMMTRALAQNGAKKVYILGRRKEKLEEAAASNPSVIVPVVCDVTSKQSLQAAVDKITAETGYLNLLVANAGVVGPLSSFDASKSIKDNRKALFDDVVMEDVTNVYNVNVTSVYFTFAAFLELLDAGNKKALDGGFGAPLESGSDVPSIQSQVIITSSIASFIRVVVSFAYGTSKAAVTQLTKQISSIMAPYGIRANAFAPGLYPSDLAAPLLEGRDPGKETIDQPNFIPARRFGTDQDMAGTLLYLASRAGSFCNGNILVHDGGKLSIIPASY